MELDDWVRAFGGGDLIAASCLQPGLERFETSFGLWCYRRVHGMEITLGGPLCAPHDRADMLARFMAHARRPILYYLRAEDTALVAGHPTPRRARGSARQLHCAGIGIDRAVDLPALLARPSKPVRGALHHARRAHLRLEELDLGALTPRQRARLEQITARYLSRSAVSVEMSFINQPMRYEPDGMRRVFALVKHDREHDGTFGYAVLNPIYDAGQVCAWLLDILRFERTRVWGVWLSTVHALARLLDAEGRGHGLHLGHVPLHGVEPAPHAASRVLQAQVLWMVRYLSTTPYLAQLRRLKHAIAGPSEPRFMASFTRLAPAVFVALIEAMGVGLPALIGPGWFEVIGEGIARQRQRVSHSD